MTGVILPDKTHVLVLRQNGTEEGKENEKMDFGASDSVAFCDYAARVRMR